MYNRGVKRLRRIKTMTITQLENELNYVRKGRKSGKYEQGVFGVRECRKSIEWEMKATKKDISHVYAGLVAHALVSPFFNEIMIVACEEMMEENK